MFSPVVTLVNKTRHYIGLELTVGPKPQPQVHATVLVVRVSARSLAHHVLV